MFKKYQSQDRRVIWDFIFIFINDARKISRLDTLYLNDLEGLKKWK